MSDDDSDRGAERADYTTATATTTDKDDRQTLEDWAGRLRLSVPDLEVFCRNGFYYDKVPPHDGPARRSLLAYLKRAEAPPSKWLLISGLYPEFLCSETERRKRLRALYKALILLIRRALARQAADPFKGERTLFWDPIAEVCRDLEIAPSKLSSFCKEFCGHSLSQVVDCVRAEKIKKLMRSALAAFMSTRTATCASFAVNSDGTIDVWSVWSELRKSRKWPEFSQNTWALEFGFSSYRRMYRACLAVHGESPHQLEVTLIRQLLHEAENDVKQDSEAEELSLVEIEKRVKEIRVYTDEGILGPD